jgi:hypothetical protein
VKVGENSQGENTDKLKVRKDKFQTNSKLCIIYSMGFTKLVLPNHAILREKNG